MSNGGPWITAFRKLKGPLIIAALILLIAHGLINVDPILSVVLAIAAYIITLVVIIDREGITENELIVFIAGIAAIIIIFFIIVYRY